MRTWGGDMDDLTLTRSVLLELKEESRSMHEAYSFLDEKRTMLAGTLVQQIKRYAEARTSLEMVFALAVPALKEAITWHGMEALHCQPARTLDPSKLRVSQSAILGVDLVDAALEHTEGGDASQSQVAGRCAHQFEQLTMRAATLAALSGNLLRLFREYQRTERRARALEDVLLPELEEATKTIDDHLEAIDLEEAVRVRCLRYR